MMMSFAVRALIFKGIQNLLEDVQTFYHFAGSFAFGLNCLFDLFLQQTIIFFIHLIKCDGLLIF